MSTLTFRKTALRCVLVVTLGATFGTARQIHAESPPGDPQAGGPALDAVQSRPTLQRIGTTSLTEIAARHAAAPQTEALANGPELPQKKRPNAIPDTRQAPAIGTPDPPSTAIADRGAGVLGFEGLRHTDSRFASNGNQFSGEPPDQALCVGNGLTFEMVNQAVTVYDANGAQLVPTASLNEFYGLPPNITRTNPPTFGPFIFDPVCLYDSQVQRWFVLNVSLDQDPVTGNFTGGSHLLGAVSVTSDPTGPFAIYDIVTTDGDETDANCPCFDDFPHIGMDANGIYIGANRFSLFGPDFNGAQIYAVSKRGLARNAAGVGRLPVLVSINAGPVNGNPSFTVQPASVPPGGTFPPREYFLSTLDFSTISEDRIAVWALSNTASLNTVSPNVRLTRKVISSLLYSFEPDVTQKPGPAPLAALVGEPLNKLDSASDMTEVVYANGKLWSATTTAIGPDGGTKRAGVLWWQVRPSFSGSTVGGAVVHQGYVAAPDGNSLIYPSVGVNPAGRGAMVLSLAGPNVYPSQAFIAVDNGGVSGPIRVTQYGTGPEDGFSCYAAFGSRDRGCRWGDYSKAVADANGNIWMASEIIPNGARTQLANWGTYIARLIR